MSLVILHGLSQTLGSSPKGSLLLGLHEGQETISSPLPPKSVVHVLSSNPRLNPCEIECNVDVGRSGFVGILLVVEDLNVAGPIQGSMGRKHKKTICSHGGDIMLVVGKYLQVSQIVDLHRERFSQEVW
jgi:hypothetical protein